jgi:2-dehydropantoate 2-reductase
VAAALREPEALKFLIAGAGAIGGYIGRKLARAGEDVTLFARGPHLPPCRRARPARHQPEGDFEVRPKIIGDLAEAGPST